MKIIAVVQARMRSTRLPNKAMKKINSTPIIQILFSRLSKSTCIDDIILATSEDKSNLPLISHISNLGYKYEIGSEEDVLDRYLQVAKKHKAEIIVRITGDCPLVDPLIVDQCIKELINSNIDYCTNTFPPTFPDGFDVSVMRINALKKAAKEATDKFDREHVTSYIKKNNNFSKKNIVSTYDWSMLRLTIDNTEDYEVLSLVFKHFSPNIYFSWLDVVNLYKKNPSIFNTNKHIKRNEGSIITKKESK